MLCCKTETGGDVPEQPGQVINTSVMQAKSHPYALTCVQTHAQSLLHLILQYMGGGFSRIYLEKHLVPVLHQLKLLLPAEITAWAQEMLSQVRLQQERFFN